MKTRYIVPLLLFCLFACMACEDDKTEMPRLFRPSFIASSCFAEDNTITLAWRTSGEATSYTVELSQDATFQVFVCLLVCHNFGSRSVRP